MWTPVRIPGAPDPFEEIKRTRNRYARIEETAISFLREAFPSVTHQTVTALVGAAMQPFHDGLAERVRWLSTPQPSLFGTSSLVDTLEATKAKLEKAQAMLDLTDDAPNGMGELLRTQAYMAYVEPLEEQVKSLEKMIDQQSQI